MEINGTCRILRIYIGESDRFDGAPLHTAIVRKVKEAGLAGATVLRGIEGFGAANRIHRARALQMSDDLPVVIEIVDKAERIDQIIPIIDAMVAKGLITIENIEVVAYRHTACATEGDAPAACELDPGES